MLEQIVAERREGTKLSDILREALLDYIDNNSPTRLKEEAPAYNTRNTRKKP